MNNELYLADLKPLENNQIVKRPRKERIKSFLQPETPVESLTTDNELLVVRPNFWTHKGNGYVQFTQHYISDNWYKGGESTNALLSGLVLEEIGRASAAAKVSKSGRLVNNELYLAD